MKALTIWQPWATLCVRPSEDDATRPVKPYETRGWATLHRGTLAIHAAKKWTAEMREMCCLPPFSRLLGAEGYSTALSPTGGLPLGAIVGVVDLVDMFATDLTGWVARLDPTARALGDFSPGRVAWQLANPRPLPEPIPCGGRQGLWNLDEITIAEIERQIGRAS